MINERPPQNKKCPQGGNSAHVGNHWSTLFIIKIIVEFIEQFYIAHQLLIIPSPFHLSNIYIIYYNINVSSIPIDWK